MRENINMLKKEDKTPYPLDYRMLLLKGVKSKRELGN